MKVVSVNIAEGRTIEWRGKMVETGIYKKAVKEPISLTESGVEGDIVADRQFHGGLSKACYIYSADWYPFWQKKYPELEFEFGMFGENVSVRGLNEERIHIGDIFWLGQAKIQVLSAREPCFKLGVKFGTQQILKEFIKAPYPGIYVAVLEEGEVTKGDTMTFMDRPKGSISLLAYHREFYNPDRNPDFVEVMLDNEFLPEQEKTALRKKMEQKD
jgi:MOSC domain-containing protein YiiM